MKLYSSVLFALFFVAAAQAQPFNSDDMMARFECDGYTCFEKYILAKDYVFGLKYDNPTNTEYQFKTNTTRQFNKITTRDVVVAKFKGEQLFMLTYSTHWQGDCLSLKYSFTLNHQFVKQEDNEGLEGVLYKSATYPQFILLETTREGEKEGEKYTVYSLTLVRV